MKDRKSFDFSLWYDQELFPIKLKAKPIKIEKRMTSRARRRKESRASK